MSDTQEPSSNMATPLETELAISGTSSIETAHSSNTSTAHSYHDETPSTNNSATLDEDMQVAGGNPEIQMSTPLLLAHGERILPDLATPVPVSSLVKEEESDGLDMNKADAMRNTPNIDIPGTAASFDVELSEPMAEAQHSASSTTHVPQAAEEYVLKPIDWVEPKTGMEKRIKIITQNENGPCPLLTLCNTLILQGKVEIKPYDRPVIGYEHLLELLADYLLDPEHPVHTPLPGNPNSPTESATGDSVGRVGNRVEKERVGSRLQVESALRLLPHLQHGLDVNIYFKSIRGFEPTKELGLFHAFGVELVHGWIVNEIINPEMYALVDGPSAVASYNKAVECVAFGDEAAGGMLVEDVMTGQLNPIQSHQDPTTNTESTHDIEGANPKHQRISEALTVKEFLNTTSSQLTDFGLHSLQESLPDAHLCAFFRNNHFSTLFKNPMDGVLYTLVTDQSLAHEQAIVWESLEDVGGSSEFLDGLFRRGNLDTGDYARNSEPLHAMDHDGGGDEDFALALQLQQQDEAEEAARRARNNERGGSGSGSPIQYRQNFNETDEQMAMRLQREFENQELQDRQQQQARQRQAQGANSRQQQLVLQPRPGGNNMTPRGNGGGNTEWQSHPYQGQNQSQYENSVSPRSQQGGQSTGGNGQQGDRHGRESSSNSSSSSQKEKCVIS